MADILQLSGSIRSMYLEFGVAVGDNAGTKLAATKSMWELFRRQPRESFPDDVVTVDQFNGYPDQLLPKHDAMVGGPSDP